MKQTTKAFVATVRGALPKRVSVYAANASFFLTLSVFPLVLLILSLLRYLPLTIDELYAFLDGWLPPTFAPLVDNIIAEMESSNTTALSLVAAVTAVWSASRGVLGVLNGLNEVYNINDHRDYFRRRAICMFYMLVLAAAIVVTLGLHVVGERMRNALVVQLPQLGSYMQNLTGVRAVIIVPLLTLLFTVIYKVLPDRKAPFRYQLPGAFGAAVGWEGFSDLFSLYLLNSNGYSRMYGSLVTVVVAMLWLYFCMSILFFGGAANCYLENRLGRGKARLEPEYDISAAQYDPQPQYGGQPPYENQALYDSQLQYDNQSGPRQ